MNLVITVTHPLLTTGQQLKVEYSTDGVLYTFDSYQTTNTFTTTYGGFSAGNTYWFRFTLVKSLSPLVECDAVLRQITIPEEIPCWEFDSELVEQDTVWWLHINYNVPSPYVAPCSFIVKYGTSHPLTSVSYTSLPPSPLIFPASKQTYYVEVYSVDCDGIQVLCDQFEVSPPEEPCEASAIIGAELYQIGGVYYLTIAITPSNPASSTYTVNFTQANNLTTGVPDQGSFIYTATGSNPEVIQIQLSPNLNIAGSRVLSYIGNVTDNCRHTSYFDESLTIG